jgi:hypothetical protein
MSVTYWKLLVIFFVANAVFGSCDRNPLRLSDGMVRKLTDLGSDQPRGWALTC